MNVVNWLVGGSYVFKESDWMHRLIKFVCNSCHCAPGYEGFRCESNVDDCANNKCANNATCIDLVQAYRCDCPPGYMGEYCETKIPFCTKGHDPCENGGRCVDHGSNYSCECPVGFTGLNCTSNLDDCSDHLCQVKQVISQKTPLCINIHGKEWNKIKNFFYF